MKNTTTEHKQYIVTLRWPSARPVPKYGNFIWNANLHRLVWRNEIAETMGQLAELLNQAVVFVREQDNTALFVEVVPVPMQEVVIPAEDETANAGPEMESTPNAELSTSNTELEPESPTPGYRVGGEDGGDSSLIRA